MNRTNARKILREFFPCYLQERFYCSYEALRKRDPIMVNDLLDYIQWNEPIPYKISTIELEQN